MNCVLFSYGSVTQKLIKKGLTPTKIISFDDSKIDNINVISVYDLKTNYNNETILIPSFIEDDVNVDTIYNKLIAMGFSNDLIYFIPIEMILGESKIEPSKFYKYGEVNYLDYLEISIVEHCNMNCKGCSHFSNLAPKTMSYFSEYVKDFNRLKELIPHIFKIRIMGGEPLLNPELSSYIKLIKQIYPYTDLRVVTNGLLIDKMDDKLISTIVENDVMLDISVYPPIADKIDVILDNLKKYNIKVFLEKIDSFKPILLEEEEKYSFPMLQNCSCINMKNGFLAPCPLPFTISYFNDKFNNQYDKEIKVINIYDDISGLDIKQQLLVPFELCNYCAHYRDDLPFFSWQQSIKNQKSTDWVYKRGR